jgi:hypothetical protein
MYNTLPKFSIAIIKAMMFKDVCQENSITIIITSDRKTDF